MLNLTADERKVVLFLSSIFLLGLGVDFALKQFMPVKTLSCFSNKLAKVNLNTADKNLLMNISGIGDKLSQLIIEFRDSQGGFGEIEELKRIKGISEAKFSKIKDYLIVE